MTREEAVQVLYMVEAHGSIVIEAKEMAIKALKEQMTCSDVISRQATKEAICDYVCGKDIRCVTNHECRVKKLISELPSIQPEQGITIPDNVTNGDMIKTMFPHYDIEVDEHKGYVRIFYSDFYTTYPFEWWNAPYKREEE